MNGDLLLHHHQPVGEKRMFLILIHTKQVVTRLEQLHLRVRKTETVCEIMLQCVHGIGIIIDVCLPEAGDIVRFQQGGGRLPVVGAMDDGIAQITQTGVQIVKRDIEALFSPKRNHKRRAMRPRNRNLQTGHRLIVDAVVIPYAGYILRTQRTAEKASHQQL